ncbi:hypothetical protein [Acidianus sp. HS-5]|uniref:hypothetical protein n=1 Tax=Acidianus sp. HS-5 TaxID=2886040 RepID=UPI001F343CE8|nr:hypothetical protein [Acidianus sp. HS-5]
MEIFLEMHVNSFIKMCDYKIITSDRPVKESGKAIIVSRESFNKLTSDMYLKVMAIGDREKLGLSKSYYYYILDYMKKIGLIEDNALSFKIILPFVTGEKELKFDDGIIYLNGKQIISIDMSSSKYICTTCPVFAECVYGIKRIATSMKIKTQSVDSEIDARNEKLPSKLWYSVIRGIISKILPRLDSIYIYY